MALLRNVFRSSGGLQGWTVTFPPQWKQQDSVNCGIFVCSAVENEVQKHTVTAEPLTLSQCRTLRVHHASEIMKIIDPEDFPPTLIESIEMEKKENKLQETELKKPDSSIHCLAWKIRACLFQRATGKTSVFHDHIKTYKWVQCTSCKNWLHFQCAGLPEDWKESEFFCGCSLHPDIDNLVESVEAVDIITNADIKVLEQKLQTGDILSNRMYLWKHKGLDPAICKHNSEHAVIHWLQSSINLCHYQAEMVLLRINEGDQKVQQKQGTEKESSILVDSQVAADWCRQQNFEGRVTLPVVLDYDKQEQAEALQALKSWDEEMDENSPAEHFTFVFEQKEDYEKFCCNIVDNMGLNIFARFE